MELLRIHIRTYNDSSNSHVLATEFVEYTTCQASKLDYDLILIYVKMGTEDIRQAMT